jgi:tripartite-type tricarboxylate transporter receptor subunit TctC
LSKGFRAFGACAALVLLSAAPVARADAVADFYAKTPIRITVGGTSGGGYAVYARALQRVLSDSIPGHPTIIVQYQPGASTIRAANYVYNVARKDGSEIGAFQQPVFAIPFAEPDAAHYDPAKFQWLGSLASEVTICFVRRDSGIATFQEARERTVTIGANAPSASSTTTPTALNNLLGSKFKIISGYNGPDLALATSRGEVAGQCNSWITVKTLRGDWLQSGLITVLIQLATVKEPDLPDVPLMTDFVTSEEQREALAFLFAPQKFGRPYAFPPGVPPERVAAMRAAFAAAMAKPETAAEFAKEHLDIDFVDGTRMQGLVDELLKTPRSTIDLAMRASRPSTSK